jgi:hypothetical protein
LVSVPVPVPVLVSVSVSVSVTKRLGFTGNVTERLVFVIVVTNTVIVVVTNTVIVVVTNTVIVVVTNTVIVDVVHVQVIWVIVVGVDGNPARRPRGWSNVEFDGLVNLFRLQNTFDGFYYVILRHLIELR